MDIEWITKPLGSFFFAMSIVMGHVLATCTIFCVLMRSFPSPTKFQRPIPCLFLHQNMSGYRTSHDLLISLSASNDVFTFIAGIIASGSKWLTDRRMVRWAAEATHLLITKFVLSWKPLSEPSGLSALVWTSILVLALGL